MKIVGKLVVAAAALVFAAGIANAHTVKVGVVMTFSGGAAQFGNQIEKGYMLYHNQNKDSLKHPIKFIKRDSKNPGGQVAARMVQELITRENVDILTGFVFSPNAMKPAALFTKAKIPVIIMNAGTSFIPKLSPYIARVSFSMWQSGYIMGKYAAEKLGYKTAATGYTDYPPGKDSVNAFKRGFEDSGGKVIDAIPMGGPRNVPDFTPWFQRVKDKKPDAFYVFVPAGNHATAVVKTHSSLGLKNAGVALIGPGDITQDTKLQGMGKAAEGLITVHHYSADYQTEVNRGFVKAWKAAYGADSTPDFMGVAGYDGMAAIHHVIRKLDGKIDADKAMEVLKGWTFNSPRGMIRIDPETRDIIQNEYVHQVVSSGGRLSIKVLDTFPQVKDPCKELKVGPCGK